MRQTENQSGMRSPRWRWIAAIWCAGALFDASQTVLIMHAGGKHHNWLPLFAIELVSWLPWVLATPLIIRLARRYPMTRAVSVRTVASHVVAFTVVSAVAETWSAVLQVLFNPWNNRTWPTFVDTFSVSLRCQALTFVIVYALILTVTLVLDSRERMSRQITDTARHSSRRCAGR